MSLVLLIRVNPSVSSEINDCIKELKFIEPDIYYYPVQDFHLTVMDILRGVPNRAMPDNLNDYIQYIEECRQKIKPFCIEFAGLTASDNAVMVKGYYELNKVTNFELVFHNWYDSKKIICY